MKTTEQTYAETKGENPFDWNAFLDDRIHERCEHPASDNEAEELAEDWVTCACGNQCAVLPRDIYGEPRDLILRNLGCDFAREIEWRDWKSAQIVLRKIEERTTYLLTEMQHGKEAK